MKTEIGWHEGVPVRADAERLTAEQLTALGTLFAAELRRRALTEGDRLQNRLDEYRMVVDRQLESAAIASATDAHLRRMEEITMRTEALRFRYRVERDRLESMVAGLPDV